MTKWILAFIFVIIWLSFLAFSIKKKSIKNLCLSMILGSVCIVCLSLFGGRLGIQMHLNFFNTVAALSLGAPGTILLAFCSKI